MDLGGWNDFLAAWIWLNIFICNQYWGQRWSWSNDNWNGIIFFWNHLDQLIDKFDISIGHHRRNDYHNGPAHIGCRQLNRKNVRKFIMAATAYGPDLLHQLVSRSWGNKVSIGKLDRMACRVVRPGMGDYRNRIKKQLKNPSRE